MPASIIHRRGKTAVHPDQLASLKAFLQEFTAVERPDFDRLTVTEQGTVVDLVEKGQARDDNGHPVNALDLGRLSKAEKRKLITLFEKLQGLEPGHFAAGEQERRDLAAFAEIARETKKPPRRLRYEEEGSFRVPAYVFKGITRTDRNPMLRIATLGLWVYLMGVMERGETGDPFCWVEGSGDQAALVWKMGSAPRMFGDVPDWTRRLENLDRMGLITLDRSVRGETRVRRGPKTLKALHAGDPK